MAVYDEYWSDLAARYDTEGGERTLDVSFPGGHFVRGPAGTLIGLHDLVERVLAAIDAAREEQIAGAYRWPPVGSFVSQTFCLKKDTPLGRLLHKDWNDPEQLWHAEIHWAKADDEWYSSATMSVGYWRSLHSALSRLMARPDVRDREEAAKILLE